ncbi:MAG TPA: hypothetical protein VJ600_06765 [Holophagaceae bacterium]|nr:hypothetical protein [Holophagaceae bacterium]
MPEGNLDAAGPLVGILVLNYGQPEATLACIESLLAVEPPTSRILWIENPTGREGTPLESFLDQATFPWRRIDPAGTALPYSGEVGVLLNPGNLGYGGGNNVGLRLLHRAGVPFAWVINNDSLLLDGTSDQLREAAAAEPAIGAWGMRVLGSGGAVQACQVLSTRDFASAPAPEPGDLAGDPLRYLSGCSLFCWTEAAAAVGFIPEEYFLYYEDAAFCLELRRKGFGLGFCPEVAVRHEESLASGRRSPVVEYYTRRNRWTLLERYFPGHLPAQKRLLLYRLQKYLLRGDRLRLRMEWRGWRDWRRGIRGRVPLETD